MGYANCGEDSEGRAIGYGHEAVCDHPDCREKIDRGMDFACGGQHGGGAFYCEKYFCGEHRVSAGYSEELGQFLFICRDCNKALDDNEEIAYCVECDTWKLPEHMVCEEWCYDCEGKETT